VRTVVGCRCLQCLGCEISALHDACQSQQLCWRVACLNV
jgi:hypothetical protein